MTAKQLSAYIGRRFSYHVKGLIIVVSVIDSRERFGNVDVEVMPVWGSGSVWITFGALGSEVFAKS